MRLVDDDSEMKRRIAIRGENQAQVGHIINHDLNVWVRPLDELRRCRSEAAFVDEETPSSMSSSRRALEDGKRPIGEADGSATS